MSFRIISRRGLSTAHILRTGPLRRPNQFPRTFFSSSSTLEKGAHLNKTQIAILAALGVGGSLAWSIVAPI